MITIIHGSNTVATRNQLQLIKSKYKEVISLEADKIDLTMLTETLETASFYGEVKLVIVEDFLTKKGKQNVFIEYLRNNTFPSDLVLWESREYKGAALNALSTKAKIIQVNLPLMIFKFLDSLSPANKNSLLLYQNLLERENSEVIFFMLKRQIRLLLLSLHPAGKTAGSVLPGWQQNKLKDQSLKFSPERLEQIYQRLLLMEYEIKNGLTSLALSDKLKIFLATEII